MKNNQPDWLAHCSKLNTSSNAVTETDKDYLTGLSESKTAFSEYSYSYN